MFNVQELGDASLQLPLFEGSFCSITETRILRHPPSLSHWPKFATRSLNVDWRGTEQDSTFQCRQMSPQKREGMILNFFSPHPWESPDVLLIPTESSLLLTSSSRGRVCLSLLAPIETHGVPTARDPELDNPANHQGRIRDSPHVRGQWPCHVFLEREFSWVGWKKYTIS